MTHADADYVLGTRDYEIARLGLQHRLWREKVLGAWRAAGLRDGMTAIDVGAGPGFAALDLAEAVGPDGRVVALERSPHFLAALRARAAALGLDRVEARAHDVSADAFGVAGADFAFCRWLLSFVADPAATVGHIATALRPGGVVVFFEYADYSAWRMLPPIPAIDRFRTLVERSWRDSGGEPDVTLQLPAWLDAHGFDIVRSRAHCDIIAPDDPLWQWPLAFLRSNAGRLVELGYADAAEARDFAVALDGIGSHCRMMTPLVAEIVARRR